MQIYAIKELYQGEYDSYYYWIEERILSYHQTEEGAKVRQSELILQAYNKHVELRKLNNHVDDQTWYDWGKKIMDNKINLLYGYSDTDVVEMDRIIIVPITVLP